MYYFIDENLLFTGDTILEDVTGPTFRPTGSRQDMRNSVKRFKMLGYAGETPLYPGHGNMQSFLQNQITGFMSTVKQPSGLPICDCCIAAKKEMKHGRFPI